MKYSSLEEVSENFGFPIHPLIFVHRGRGYHFLEGRVPGLFVNPLYTFWGEDRKPRRRSYSQLVFLSNQTYSQKLVPIYRVSPQLLVTNEHIISESCSTSDSDFSDVSLLRFSEYLLLDCCGSGEATLLFGVDVAASLGVLFDDGEVGIDPSD